jgi:hypothetical protein
MTLVTLPNTSRTKADPNLFSDVVENDEAILDVLNGDVSAINLAPNAVETEKIKDEAVTASKLAKGVGAIKWYTPKVIATEESRESASFGTLTTADEIKEVVVGENGLIEIDYMALVKSSVAGAGRIAFFIGSNQLKRPFEGAPADSETSTVGTSFQTIVSGSVSPRTLEFASSYVTTGMALGGTLTVPGGPCKVFGLPAGTYTVSVRYKATSGSVTAKERKLWVTTFG